MKGIISQMKLTNSQKTEVLSRAQALVQLSEKKWGISLASVNIDFKTRGSCAGKAKILPNQTMQISFNEAVFAADVAHHLQDTVAHEVAHLVCFRLFGKRIKPHGFEWKQIALQLGAMPKASGRYSLEGVSVRRLQRFLFRCSCREHQITAHRIRKITLGASYLCTFCGEKIKPAETFARS